MQICFLGIKLTERTYDTLKKILTTFHFRNIEQGCTLLLDLENSIFTYLRIKEH